MKKMLVLALALCLSVGFAPVLAEKEDGYAPALGMTINDLVNKYNLIQTPLGAPYKKLPINAPMEHRGSYFCASFFPANNSGIEMLAITLEKTKSTADAGADAVLLICYKDSDLISFISTAKRITSLFSMELFGVNYSGLYIGVLISDFYESCAKDNDQIYYIQLGADSNYCAALYYVNGAYIFALTTLDRISKIMEG